MIRGHKIKKRITVEEFHEHIGNLSVNEIKTTRHTFFRLKEGDRKIFKDRLIKEYLLLRGPILVGIQYNGNYAVFYTHKKDILKVILDIHVDYIEIVTFYIIDKTQIPRI